MCCQFYLLIVELHRFAAAVPALLAQPVLAAQLAVALQSAVTPGGPPNQHVPVAAAGGGGEAGRLVPHLQQESVRLGWLSSCSVLCVLYRGRQ